jgi:hypothetical protein
MLAGSHQVVCSGCHATIGIVHCQCGNADSATPARQRRNQLEDHLPSTALDINAAAAAAAAATQSYR